jgi:hypothetical protein
MANDGFPTPSLVESAFSDLTPRLVRYLGPNRVGVNSLIQLEDAAGGTANVLIQSETVHAILGPGGGPNGMYVPRVEFTNPAQAFAGFAAGGANQQYSAGCGFHFRSSNYSDDLGAGAAQEIANMVGKGCWLSPRGRKPANGLANAKALYDGAMFQIMAPRGLITDIPGAIDGGEWVRPLHWDTTKALQVGDQVWQANAAGGKVYGKIKEVGVNPFVTDNGIRWDLDIKQTDLANGVLGLISEANMTVPQYFELVRTNLPLTTAYTTGAAGPIVATTNSTDGNNAPYAPGASSTIKLSTAGTNHSVTVTRGGSEVVVYTPNELYNIFNRVGNSLAGAALAPPWFLQTDENGGFCVKWNMTTAPSDSFLISKAMCDSLGLNAWMDYDWIRPDPKDEYTATLLDTTFSDSNIEYDHAFGSMVVDYDANKLFKVSDQSMINPAAFVMGTIVSYYGAGKDFILVDIQRTVEAGGHSVTKRLTPVIVQQNGIDMYKYSRPPTIGQIRNTGQISVESWGTFSMINLVIPNIPFQSMLGGESDARILASLRLPFQYSTNNGPSGVVVNTNFSYYGDLLFNSDSSRSYLRITTDQQLFDCDVEARLIRRDGSMEVMQIPFKGQFQVKLRLLQTQ